MKFCNILERYPIVRQLNLVLIVSLLQYKVLSYSKLQFIVRERSLLTCLTSLRYQLCASGSINIHLNLRLSHNCHYLQLNSSPTKYSQTVPKQLPSSVRSQEAKVKKEIRHKGAKVAT